MFFEKLEGAYARAVGAKQTAKALQKGAAVLVFIARDAEEAIVRPILDLSQEKAVSVVYCDSMRLLGKACGIDVGAAAAAVLSE